MIAEFITFWHKRIGRRRARRVIRRERNAIFQQIVSLTREKMWYKETDGIGRPSAPLELKILGVLRVLGRGMRFDGIAELTNISEEAIRVYFHSFCRNFATELFSKYCKSPDSDEEVKKVTDVYEKLGLTQTPLKWSFKRNLNFWKAWLGSIPFPPDNPPRPILSLTSVTFLISSSESGDLQYFEDNSVAKFLQNEWK